VGGAAHPHYGMALEDLFDENPGADFLFWDRIAYWTVEEATALLFEFDPNLANWGELLSCDHPFTKLYENRRALALRAVEMGQLPKLAAALGQMVSAHSAHVDIRQRAYRPGAV
jgi:hypothetical protein